MDAIEVKTPDTPAPVKQPRPPMNPRVKKWAKRIAIAAVIALAVGLFVIRPMHRAGDKLTEGMYLTSTAQMEDLTVAVSGSGTITPIDSYKVGALAVGEVLEAPFEEGDWVEKGDVLYRIDAGDAETALKQAKLSVRQAQLHYDDLARNLQPTAGSAGVVQKVFVKQGDMIAAGSPIAEIADSATMTIELPFLSADASSIYAGEAAVLTLDGTLETLPAVVESVSASDMVGPSGALVRQVKLRVDNPGALTAGRAATATIGAISCAGSGTFADSSRRTVAAMTSGEVTAVNVSTGSKVNAGTALITIGGSAVNSGLENASLGIESAKLNLQRAQDALDNYVIKAPISGTVIEKNFKAGDKIETESLTAAGGSLAVIYDMSTLTFKMNINDLDINKLEVGQTVSVTTDAIKGETFTGVVDKININGITAGGFTAYPVTVQLDGDGSDLAQRGLKPGMNISAEIVVEQAGEVLCLPIDSVSRGDTVLMAGEGALNDKGVLIDPTKLEEHQVTLGRNGKDMVEIVDGLKEGDVVYVHNPASNMMNMMMGG